MEIEPDKPKKNSVFLQYLDSQEVYQYNDTPEDIPMPPCEFENEVRKSATDMEEWERKQKEKEMKEPHRSHRFLETPNPIAAPEGANPIPFIINEIRNAQQEIRLLQMLLNSVTSPESVSFQYTSRRRVTPSVLPDEDYHKTKRTLISNLEASYLLFRESSAAFSNEITTMRDLVTKQRHFFNDLLYYRKLVNIMVYHGSELTFVRNIDPLLAYCGFENRQDIDACLRLFPGREGYIQMKPHDTSCYSFLCITTALIDDARSYESSYEFHAKKVDFSPFSSPLKQGSASPYLRSNLHLINCTYHSVLCRRLFQMLYDGCLLLLNQENTPCSVEVGNESILFTVDAVFSIKIELKTAPNVLVEEDALAALFENKNEGANSLLKVLETLNSSFLEGVLRQYYANLHTNKHLLPIRHVTDTSFKESQNVKLAMNACRQFLFLYRKLFINYFVFVVSLQFDSLVYSNIELTKADSKLAIKKTIMNDLYIITVIFKTFGISNCICISLDGVTVNGKEYTSLFDAFSGVLCFFMQDIRLLYLNACLQQKLGINIDLGNDLTVVNGNGVITVISFDYLLPSPVAFYHAFVMYCNQGNVINKDSGYIRIGRRDRENKDSSPVCSTNNPSQCN